MRKPLELSVDSECEFCEGTGIAAPEMLGKTSTTICRCVEPEAFEFGDLPVLQGVEPDNSLDRCAVESSHANCEPMGDSKPGTTGSLRQVFKQILEELRQIHLVLGKQS